MKKVIMFSFVLLLVGSGRAYSQEHGDNGGNISHLFGLSGSTVSGVGLSYMYYLTPDYHIKFTGLPFQYRKEIKTEDGESGFNNTVWANGGVELRRNFAVIKKARVMYQFYNLAGGSYWYIKKERPFNPEEDRLTKTITGGLGIGTGFVFIDRLSVNVDLYYQYARWIDYGRRYAGPGAGISCYLAF